MACLVFYTCMHIIMKTTWMLYFAMTIMLTVNRYTASRTFSVVVVSRDVMINRCSSSGVEDYTNAIDKVYISWLVTYTYSIYVCILLHIQLCSEALVHQKSQTHNVLDLRKDCASLILTHLT